MSQMKSEREMKDMDNNHKEEMKKIQIRHEKDYKDLETAFDTARYVEIVPWICDFALVVSRTGKPNDKKNV